MNNVGIYSFGWVIVFFSKTEAVLLNSIFIFYPERFMLDTKVLHNGSSLDLSNSFDFQAVIYSGALSSFKSNILNVGWKQMYLKTIITNKILTMKITWSKRLYFFYFFFLF